MTNDAISNYPELAALVNDWPKFLQPTLDAQTLSGKQIVVTGAGDGIGKALAKTLACLGANVILLGRTRSKLETVFDWINQHTNTDPVIVPCDLARL
ncbi:MAG: SDR family NAD(P)-dependent oxidoreductase, partial [Pseudomonadota bacterium]|nr:SDR family NAD(P)-dependent oxidoreductase [Pseudomonadota bacterium]